MKTKSNSKAAFFNPRVLLGFALCSAGLFLGLAGLSKSKAGAAALTGRANPVAMTSQDGVAEDGEADTIYYGYCEASDSTGRWQTNGQCVSHNLVGFCYIKASTDCPNGRRVHELSSVSCGGLGSAEVDLARSCSFQGD